MDQHQSNNTKKTYMASWLDGINCQDVSDLIDKVIIHKYKRLNATLCFHLRMVKL